MKEEFYLINTMLKNDMKELSLREIKQIEYDVLLFFKDFCEKNNIKYYLSNGTLLGAIKYRGFIPWDDDVDVFVPREDYDKLLCQYLDTEQYKLFSIERNANFYFPFAKLCDMSTVKYEAGINNGMLLGLDVDIFPLDNWKENDSEKQLKIIKKQMARLVWAKINFGRGRNVIRTIVKNILIIWWRIIGAARICKKIQKVAQFSKNNSSSKKGCVVWPIYGEKEIIPTEVFSGFVEVEFEGEKFPAPIGYDVYLRSLYGDYKKDLPKEKQRTHHNFKAYKIN